MIDPPLGSAPGPGSRRPAQPQPMPMAAGIPELLSEPVLLIQQHTQLVEINAEYSIYNYDGTKIGSARETGNSIVKQKSGWRALYSRNYEILDRAGGVVLFLHQPRGFIQTEFIVGDGHNRESGRIKQVDISLLKSNFELPRDGYVIGKIITEDWTEWDFSIRDAWDNEVAHISKHWGEIFDELMFETVDNYMVQMFQFRDESLRPLVVAAAMVIDSVLNQ